MTDCEYEAEIASLHAFVMQLAERIAAASEVLSMVAERKDSAMAMKCEHKQPIEGGPNPCPHCPPIPTQAPMEKIIAVGFGCAMLTRDGVQIIDGENPPGEEFFTFQDAEKMALLDPDHDWQVVLHGPLHGETYQRQGAGQWVCIERNEGFA